MYWYGVVICAVAALAYGATAVILFANRPSRVAARFFASAIAVSSVWAGGTAALLLGHALSYPALTALDAIRLVVWTGCVLSWLPRSAGNRSLFALSIVAGIAAFVFAWPALGLVPTMYATLVVMTVIGLFAVEQAYRNAGGGQRKTMRLLCLAACGVFVVDLFFFSQAAVVSMGEPTFWASRGMAQVLVLPLIVIAVKRQSGWERALFVSRHVVFYAASLVGIGGYLMFLGIAAYAMHATGEQWSFIIVSQVLLVAFALLFLLMTSSVVRTRLRVFLIKHFYSNKYDYRQEWLRLTQILGRSSDLRVLAYNGLDALAQIGGSPRGELWLTRDGVRYEWMASIGSPEPKTQPYGANHPIVRFLEARSWVIDSEEYAADPSRYDNMFGDVADGMLPPRSIIVPLECQEHLQGFVVLENSAGAGALNFEDHDILKTAGKQVGVALAQALTLEKLAETRQFEAMNKMSTFLMHDLKNIIAQQQLVVENAARFRMRPGFFDDAIVTIRSGVDRMRHVLEQLNASRVKPQAVSRADLSKVLMEVRSRCSDREPIPDVDASAGALWVRIEREKLASVLSHLVRNAQDATPALGKISITVTRTDTAAVCEVADTGCGMDPIFVRDRLFRPFDSTKGVHGMGIGVYQARDWIRAAGGDVEVASAVGVGTTFKLRLPLADASIEGQQTGVPAT